ncbi:MAG: type 1 glutamine amidotransferase domain-containing protein [Nannocystaceae bacterium]|nr:type 1 glutamine amidotransferase domain-containing protein [Nannocystaceae bacterium]
MSNTTSPRILFVLTSHATIADTGKSTGAFLAEITHPYYELVAAGATIDFVSVAGGKVPLDGVDRKDPINARGLDDAALMRALETTPAPSDIDATRYDAVFFAGGHGTMWDFRDARELAAIAARVYERGGVVAAVCHGPAGLLGIELSDGRALVAGKRVAAFTNEEERAVGLAEVVPFLLADALVARGAEHVPGPKWAPNVVVDGRLVTGQNPASATGVARAIAELCRAR